MNNLAKFKEHLREAKRAGWELDSIIESINIIDCPFQCGDCPQIKQIGMDCLCEIFEDKKDYFGIWLKQSDWYESYKYKPNLIKIAKQVWEEK